MDLRFLSLKSKAHFNRLTRPLPIDVAGILTRPAIKLHDAKLSDADNFIAVQVLGLTGSFVDTPTTATNGNRVLAPQHIVYLMLAQGNDYIGRTCNKRETPTTIGCILPGGPNTFGSYSATYAELSQKNGHGGDIRNYGKAYILVV